MARTRRAYLNLCVSAITQRQGMQQVGGAAEVHASKQGQIIGRLVYEPLTEVPSQVYGQGIGSNYQRQGLKLSKHFRPYDPTKR